MTEERGSVELESVKEAVAFQAFPYNSMYNQIAIVLWM